MISTYDCINCGHERRDHFGHHAKKGPCKMCMCVKFMVREKEKKE